MPEWMPEMSPEDRARTLMFFNTTGGMTRSGLCNKKQWQQASGPRLFVGDAHWWGKSCATSCLRWWPVVSTLWSRH